jgi:hypothetical protein
MSIFKCTHVAFFQRLGSQGQNMPLETMLDGIKGNRWAGQIKRLRSKERDAPDYAKLKTALPAFMLSGTTNGGHKAADFAEHSGLLQIDLDGIGSEGAGDLRNRIGQDRHIIAAWLSPSGDGVKAIMRIPANVPGHKAAFAAAAVHMKETYGVEIDRTCSDVSRLCFVSHDTNLALNFEAVPLDVSAVFAEPVCPVNSSESLSPESYVLCNSLFIDFPNLKPLYFKLVQGRIGKPQRGERNDAMVEIVASMFCVVSPFFALAFADEFYHQHAEVFSDYDFQTYQREALAVLAGCHASYPSRINAGERAAYAALPDERSRTAFRIAQSLAGCDSEPDFPPPIFFLSCEELRTRIKVFRMDAWRILKKLEKAGIIKVETLGKVWTKGNEHATATVWRWML